MRKSELLSSRNIFQRALSSSIAGLPIAYAVNVFIFIPLVFYLQDYPWWVIGLVGAVPFAVTSMARMFVIDWLWFRHKINIDPRHLLSTWWFKRG
jgi:hypothetical protein